MTLSRRALLISIVLVGILSSAVQAQDSLRAVIDKHIEAAWKEHNVTPSPLAGDAEFLRRVSLDLVGQIPSYDQLTAFVADKSPNKRQEVVDRLLAEPRFASHQAQVWDLAYFGRAEGSLLRERPGFLKWMEKQFADNVPYDQWARALLKAEGSTYNDGTSLLLAKTARDPLDTTVSITRLFLGMQLQCARCHDHPYDDFTQRDFYGVAAFYTRVEPVSMGSKDGIYDYVIGEKNTGELMFTGAAADQKPGDEGQPITPKFLFGDELQEPAPPKDVNDPRNFPNNKLPPQPAFSRKNALADWITKADNPYFAKAVANRVWGQFMGRGLAHPVDNLSEDNPASHPELLEELGKQMVAHDFDLKWYIREIVNTRAYQRSALGESTETVAPWYERGRIRPLAAEELFDSIAVALDLEGAIQADKKGGEAMQKDLDNIRRNVIRTFGEPLNGTGMYQGNMFENLFLNNDGYFDFALRRRTGNLLDQVLASEADVSERIDLMFQHILSRKANPAEQERFATYVKQEDGKQDDLWYEAIWVLLASPEFRFNH